MKSYNDLFAEVIGVGVEIVEMVMMSSTITMAKT